MKKASVFFIATALVFIALTAAGAGCQHKNDAQDGSEKSAASDDDSQGYDVKLSDLLLFDKCLTDDTDVTFGFTSNTSTGFTYTAKNENGNP